MVQKQYIYKRRHCRIALICTFCFIQFMAVAQQVDEHNNHSKKQATETVFPKADAFKDTKLTYKIIPAPNNTFGYDVYANGKLMIHQKSIPALPGNNGFKTKAAAEKVAQLVIQKIKKGEMPPTISIEEMKKLKAISR